jgi:hypothetical protein
MARPHFIKPSVPSNAAVAVRLGAGATPAQNLTQIEVGKIAKLVGESRYDLAAVGNDIEAVITAVELAPQDGFTIGAVTELDHMNVVFDGLQGTPGTGVVAIGDIVVTGTPVAKDTALTTFPKVCKATTPANVIYKWRVVSLGTAGTGAVATTGVVARI